MAWIADGKAVYARALELGLVTNAVTESALRLAPPLNISDAEIDAYRLLALGEHAGAGYLNIMRSLRGRDAVGRYHDVVDTRRVPYPVQVLWGASDPILSLRRMGWPLLAATHLPSMTLLPGKHFLQEDNAPEIAAIIARNAA